MPLIPAGLWMVHRGALHFRICIGCKPSAVRLGGVELQGAEIRVRLAYQGIFCILI